MALLTHRWYSSIRSLLLALLLSPWLTAASNVTVEYHPPGMSTVACANNGMTTIVGTEVGHVTYASIYIVNANPTNITTTAAIFSNLVGCEILWNTLPGFTVFANDAGFGDIALRPTSSTWSFDVSFDVAGDPGLTTFSHSFSDTGISSASGPQLEVNLPGSNGTMVSNSLQEFPGAHTGRPIATGLRITNRSSLAVLSVITPGWIVSSGPVNCTVAIENQPPNTLVTDQAATTTLRVTPTNAGAFSVTFQLTTNDVVSPYTFRVGGTGVDKPRLVALNGTTKLSAYSQVTVTTTVGNEKHVTFTLRNEDTVPITFAADMSSGASINCSPTTTREPKTTLQPGKETRWQIAFTPTASDWQFVPRLELSSPSSETYTWLVSNRSGLDPYSAPPSSGDSSDSKCGIGGGISSFLLLGLGVLLALSSMARAPRRHKD